MSNEFNTKLLKLDGLLMEYKLADMREKYPDMFHTILGIYTEKDAKIQQLKQQLEEAQKELSGISGQLKEAVEVVEFYLSKDLSDCIFKSDEDRHRQFLAKYRGEK